MSDHVTSNGMKDHTIQEVHMADTSRPDLDTIRSWFPILRSKTYLANGNVVPCALPVQVEMNAFNAEWCAQADGAYLPGWERYLRATELYGAIVGIDPSTIVSIPDTTTGINLAVQIIDPKPGSNVVVHENSYSAAVFPFLRLASKGVEVRYAPQRGPTVPIDGIAQLVDAKTAAISICHVTTGNGFRFDLESVCEVAARYQTPIVVDAAQSAGAFRIDLRTTPVDFFAAPTFKWLLGPLGAGFLHVREDWIQRSVPPMIGPGSVIDGERDLHRFELHPTARRFERGVLPMTCFAGAKAGLEILTGLGMDWVEGRILDHADRVYAGLLDLGDRVRILSPAARNERAGLVAFTTDRAPELYEHLEAAGIHTYRYQGSTIRIDAQFYNTDDEIALLLAEIRAFLDSTS
jgi:cysteine desulfurase/selenocysteine lyase